MRFSLDFAGVLKRSVSADLMQVKLFFVTVNLNCRMHTVSVGKSPEWVSNFWTVRFFKAESEPIFSFPHITNRDN